MTTALTHTGPDGEPRRFETLVVSCFAVSLAGVYWDDAWHTDRGRDALLSPPHVALYAGVAGAVLVVVWWALRTGGPVREFLPQRRNGALGVGMLGAIVTLGSAPVDEWWHASFGRDAVLWSPPHLFAVAGTIALGTGVALAAGRRVDTRPTPLVVRIGAGAAVLGGWQVLVMEYDTDVAQFAEGLYLPVMAGGLAAGVVIVQAAAGSGLRWPALRSGVVHLVAMGVLIAGLRVAGFSSPTFPVAVAAFAVADETRRRGWNALSRGAAFSAALFITYVPYLRVVPGGFRLTGAAVTVGVVVGSLLATVAIVVFDPVARLPAVRSGGVVVTVLVIVAATAVGGGSARAHDPGQGIDVAPVGLRASPTLSGVAIEAVLSRDASSLVPYRLVARRAGREMIGRLVDRGSRWTGSVDLDESGRWFVYVEARRGVHAVEAWVPVVNGRRGSITTKATWLYLPAGRREATLAQTIAGTILVMGTGFVVAAMAVAVRRRVTQELETAATLKTRP